MADASSTRLAMALGSGAVGVIVHDHIVIARDGHASFRALGLLVPVWDLPDGMPVEEVEEPAAAFRSRLDDALSETAPLSGVERRARHALAARQLTVN